MTQARYGGRLVADLRERLVALWAGNGTEADKTSLEAIMDITAVAVLIILVTVIIILALLFRDRIKVVLRGPFRTRLQFEGSNPATNAARTSKAVKSAVSPAGPGRTTMASGERSVAVGGNASGPILTGDSQNPGTDAARAGKSKPVKSSSSPAQRSWSTTAAGERSVGVGGDATGPIITGDKNKIA
jgi:hypothetical protein